MQRFDGLTFSRQGLQVLALVVTPILFTGALFGLFALVPALLNTVWVYIALAMAFFALTIWVTLRLHYRAALVPCNIVLTNDSFIIHIEKTNIFYPKKQRVFGFDNIKNASCSLDTYQGRSFINITTRHPKATYTIQYLDERGTNPNPELWQQMEALLEIHNGDSRHQKITNTGFFEGTLLLVLIFISGLFLIAFSIAMIADPVYRNSERIIKLLVFVVLFSGLLSSYVYTKRQKKNH